MDRDLPDYSMVKGSSNKPSPIYRKANAVSGLYAIRHKANAMSKPPSRLAPGDDAPVAKGRLYFNVNVV
jgi:hypothetical protein